MIGIGEVRQEKGRKLMERSTGREKNKTKEDRMLKRLVD